MNRPSGTGRGRSRRATSNTHPTTPVQGKRKSIGDILSEDSPASQGPSRRLRSKSQPATGSTSAQKACSPKRGLARRQPAPLKAPAKSALPASPLPVQGSQQRQALPPTQFAEQYSGPMTTPNPHSTFQTMMDAPPSLPSASELQEPHGVPCSVPPPEAAFDGSSSQQEAEEEEEEESEGDENDEDEDSKSSTPSTSPLPSASPTVASAHDSFGATQSNSSRIIRPIPRRANDTRALDALLMGPSTAHQAPPSSNSTTIPVVNAGTSSVQLDDSSDTSSTLCDSEASTSSSGNGASRSTSPEPRGPGNPSLKRKREEQPQVRKSYSSLQEAADDPEGPGVLKAIHEFFNMTPPEILKGRNHTTSPNTRDPQKYDRHLDHRITLKGVIYRPEMEADLRKLAETTVLRRWNENDIPDIDEDSEFPCPKHRVCLEKPGSRTVTEEAGVVDFYNELSTYVATIVATLYFGRCSWKSDILGFSRVFTGQGKDAIADGCLRVDLGLAAGGAPDESLDRLEAEILQGQNLLLWEFKSLTVGKLEVMAAIMELAGHQFDWTYCEYGLLSDRCRDEHKPTQDNETDGEIFMHKPVVGPQATGPEAEVIWPQSFGVCDATRQWKERDPDLEVEDKDREHAKWVIQQVWAQLVKNDVTLAVINCGKWEIYCRRDRIRNTLSLSNVVAIDKCEGYGQLQVGLYLAALHDAKIRFTLAREQLTSSHDPSPSQPSPVKRTSNVILRKACMRNKLILTIQPKVRRRLAPDTKCLKEGVPYLRHQEQLERSEDENERIRVQITSQISESVFVGNLSVGTSMFRGFKGFNERIIVKISDDKRSNDKLEDEYRAFNQLNGNPSTRQLVPTVIGVFRLERRKASDFLAMLLQNVGTDLDQIIWRMPDSQLPQLSDLREPFLKALRAIHAANIMHGAIERHHHLILKETKKTKVKIQVGQNSQREAKKGNDGKHGKKYKTITVLEHEVAFISFDLVKASSYTEESEISKLESLFPDEQGLMTPPIPRGKSASPSDRANKISKLGAYDFTGRIGCQRVVNAT